MSTRPRATTTPLRRTFFVRWTSDWHGALTSLGLACTVVVNVVHVLYINGWIRAVNPDIDQWMNSDPLLAMVVVILGGWAFTWLVLLGLHKTFKPSR